MSTSPFRAALAGFVVLAGAAAAHQDVKLSDKGAAAYRACAGCHSLRPGVHLSGPSLAGLWGKKAASVAEFGRYSEALKQQDRVWDEGGLDAWLADPQAVAPGTTMTFRGLADDEIRANLIAFLRLAMADGGDRRVVAEGLVPASMADGPIPADLSAVGADQRVSEIRHCRDAYHVTTAGGARFPFWETNVRLKADSSRRGPGPGGPVLVGSGMAGDRVSVVFSSLKQLRDSLAEKC